MMLGREEVAIDHRELSTLVTVTAGVTHVLPRLALGRPGALAVLPAEQRAEQRVHRRLGTLEPRGLHASRAAKPQ